MDKYEFNVKVEQIKKLVNKGDYETAMKIADTIDWRRVRSTSLLTMVAQVYERNEEYQDAKDILLLAFERAPIGKGLLFKLTDLALREGNIPEAEAYYREFCDLSADDPRQNLLRYLILEAKAAPMEQRVHSLEKYSQEELDEKWLYKLAELYHETGNEDACVRMCDKIMLMFGLGKYVDKAMELKLQHAPLTDYQMDLVENREKYEEKLRAVEQRFTSAPKSQMEDDYDEEDSYDMPDGEDSSPLADGLLAKMHEEEAEQDLAKEVSRFDPYEEEDSSMGVTRVLGDIRGIKQFDPIDNAVEETDQAADFGEAEAAAAMMPTMHGNDDGTTTEDVDTIVEDWDQEPEDAIKYHLMIEAEESDSGLAFAIESLKKIHKELGSKNPVAKIGGDNLNKKGVFAVSDRLAGKDLIVEHAADLNPATITELSELMEQDNTGMLVVLIDTPVRMERLHNNNPGLAEKFQYIGCYKPADHRRDIQEETNRRDMQEEANRRDVQEEANRRDVQEEANRRDRQAEAELLQENARRHQRALEEEEARLRAIREEEALRQRTTWEEAEEQRRQAESEASEAARQIRYQQDDSGEAYAAEENAPERNTRYAEPEHTPYTSDEEYTPNEQHTSSEQYDQDAQIMEEEPRSRVQDDGKEMDVEEFAQYACKYAAEIDCTISGKSMLALYERAEMMEEDSVPLTKTSAAELVEEAADKAERHSIGGFFSSKYDKDGLLVLKEKHFFD